MSLTNSSTQEVRQVDLYEFKASLVYIVSSMPARATRVSNSSSSYTATTKTKPKTKETKCMCVCVYGGSSLCCKIVGEFEHRYLLWVWVNNDSLRRYGLLSDCHQ